MKALKIFTPAAYSVDKHNLRYLLSNIPTKQNGNPLTTKLSAANGSITDLRAIGGETIINIGESHIKINHLNGEVIDYKKPFFKSLKKLINQATELLTYVSDNIKNPEKVKKHTLETLTFTKEQVKKLSEIGKKA